MSTHGHRFLSDMIYGTTVDKVRHKVEIPVLLLKAPQTLRFSFLTPKKC